MDKLEPPQILLFEGNVRENWRRWRQHAREVYNTFTFAEPDANMKGGPILEKFTEYCNPHKNITFTRYQFFSYSQVEGQPFDQFVTGLKKGAAYCEFGDLKDSLIRDRGTYDAKLRERYLRETELSLEKAIQRSQAAEETKKHARELQSIKPHPIDSVDTITTKTQDQHISTRANFLEKCRFCGRGHERGSCYA